MNFPTVQEIMADIIPALGQVDGSAVQVYTDPIALKAINSMFNMLYDKREWEHLWQWQVYTLDGSTGTFTSAVNSGARTPIEIREVREASTERIIVKPRGLEHLRATGSTPLYYTFLPWDDPLADDQVIKIWPPTATGQVYVHEGHRPEPFEDSEDVVPMYKQLIVTGAVWFMLADDGMNPDSALKAQTLYDSTFKDIVSKLNKGPIGHGSGRRRGDYFTLS